MGKSSTVVVTGRNSMHVPNLASLDRVLKNLRRPSMTDACPLTGTEDCPTNKSSCPMCLPLALGMDATVPTGSVRITTAPVMGPHDDCCDCGCEGCNDGDLQDD